MTAWRSLAFGAVLGALPAAAASAMALECTHEIMCIAFTDGLYQCDRVEDAPVSIDAAGIVSVGNARLQAVASEGADVDPGWTYRTEASRFDLVYLLVARAITGSDGYTLRTDILYEGEVRGHYQGWCDPTP